jgi:effector-binding domain-containing protein
MKKIFFGLLALLVLLAIVGLMLPGKMEITRNITIAAPAKNIFEEINDLERWGKWSYWNDLYKDDMQLTYGDKRVGLSAWYSWTGKKSGDGKVTITESIPGSSIKTDLDFMEHGVAKGWYTFTPKSDSTQLTIGFASDLGPNPISRWFGIIMKPEMNKAFDYNLTHLKALAEAKPVFTVKITEENTAAVHYVGMAGKASDNSTAIGKQLETMYGTLLTVLTKAKVKVTGPAMGMYPGQTNGQIDIVAALPVAPDAKLPKPYKVEQIPAGKAVKAVHTGAYDKLMDTHQQVNRYITGKQLTISGSPWEIYVTDPTVVQDTAQWITEVYYPIQ